MVVNLPITRENWKWKYDHDQENPKIYLEGRCRNVIFLFPGLFILYKSYQFFCDMMEEFQKFKIPTPKAKKKWEVRGFEGVLLKIWINWSNIIIIINLKRKKKNLKINF